MKVSGVALSRICGLPRHRKLTSTSGGSTKLTAPSNGGSANVTATVKDQSLQVSFSVKEPSGIDHAIIISTNHYSAGISAAGMSLNVWFAPTSVSFYRVQVMEVGEDASDISGYFTLFAPPSHKASGADHWSANLGVDNSISDDCSLGSNQNGCPQLPSGGWSSEVLHGIFPLDGKLRALQLPMLWLAGIKYLRLTRQGL